MLPPHSSLLTAQLALAAGGSSQRSLCYTSAPLVIHRLPVPISVRLPHRVEQELEAYCVSHKVTKSEAVKRALMQLLATSKDSTTSYALAKRFIGSDKRPGDVARHSKRLLREHFRSKTSLG